MSEAPDKDSKTEEATEKRVHDALEKGQVPVSREAPVLASLLAILALFVLLSSGAVVRISASLMQFLDHPEDWRIESGADATSLLSQALGQAALALLPALLLLIVAGLLASILQNTPRLVPDRIMPKLSRIAIDKGWSRIFGLHGQVEFLKACFKIGAVGLVAYWFLRDSGLVFLNAIHMEAEAIPEIIRTLAVKALILIAILTTVLVVADIAWSRFSWARDLRMTKQEVKDEFKDMDGDPLLKARMRSLQRDRARKRMISSVPNATMVIANPTHYAVALRYVRGESRAPRALAKGRDLIALKIREVAEAHNIPVIEDKRLARSLYENVDVDKLIPPEFYQAVAEIILFLQGRRNKPRPPVG